MEYITDRGLSEVTLSLSLPVREGCRLPPITEISDHAGHVKSVSHFDRRHDDQLSILLQPLFSFENDQAADDYHSAQHKNRQVAITPFQLRHISKIHAIPSRDESQRHKDGCYDRKQRHRLVLADFQLCIMKIPYLDRIIAE